jgi:hypothetical protein
MQKHHDDLVFRWFEGLNAGDLDALVALFAEHPHIRNAANPPLTGSEAPRRLLEDFFSRTAARRFDLIDTAENGREVFAAWTALLTFRRGATVAGVTLPEDLELPLRGVERFVLDPNGRIAELYIVHETTTIAQAAHRAAAAAAQEA